MKLDLFLSFRPHFLELLLAVQCPLSRTNNVDFVANFTNQLCFHICFFFFLNLKTYLTDSCPVT